MPNNKLNILAQVPAARAVRARLAEVSREAALLRRLLRLSLRADECRQQTKGQVDDHGVHEPEGR